MNGALPAALVATALLVASMPVPAQQVYPARAIRMLVPFPAGGSTDLLARQLAERLTDTLKQPVLVENRPGGNGVIAADAVAKAKPDGYTLLMGIDSIFTINPHVYAKMPYDLKRDFTPIVPLVTTSLILSGSMKAPATSLPALIDYARANPGKVSFSTSNMVSLLVAERIRLARGLDFLHVPFKGAPDQIQALLNGTTDFAVTALVPYTSYVREGRLHGFATTGGKRESLSPNTPTLAESGFPELTYRSWFGLFGPAGMPREVVTLLNTESAKALGQPEARDRLANGGWELVLGPPEQLDRMINEEREKWGPTVRASGIKVQ